MRGSGDGCPVHLPQLPSHWGASAPSPELHQPPIWCAATRLPLRHHGAASTEVRFLLEDKQIKNGRLTGNNGSTIYKRTAWVPGLRGG